MGEKLGIRQVMEAGSIITHLIGDASNKVMTRDVAMVTLMEGLGTEEVGRGAGGSGRTFALPKEGGSIISFGQDCTLPDIEALCRGLMMQEAAGKFEVTVGDPAMRIGPTDQISSDGRVKFCAPHDGRGCRRSSGNHIRARSHKA